MNFGKTLILSLVAVAALALGVTPSQAQGPGRHPAYLHALSDLRLMRAYLDKQTPDERVDAESQRAIDEIDAAIHAIKEASFEDGKDIHDHARIDVGPTPGGRFRKAREAGDAAIADLSRDEDNDFAHGLKHRAIEHVENANRIVDHILHRFDRF